MQNPEAGQMPNMQNHPELTYSLESKVEPGERKCKMDVREIPFTSIDTSKNVRDIEKNEDYHRLKDSIKRVGLMVPLTVMKNFHGAKMEFVCISGHSRLMAMKELGLTSCPCNVLPVRDLQQTKYFATIDNLIRTQMDIIDRANAFKSIKKDLGLNTTQLAKRMGYSRVYTTGLLNIANWPADVQQICKEKKLSANKLAEIARKQHADCEIRQIISAGKVTDKIEEKKPESVLNFSRSHDVSPRLSRILTKIERIISKTPPSDRKTLIKFIRHTSH